MDIGTASGLNAWGLVCRESIEWAQHKPWNTPAIAGQFLIPNAREKEQRQRMRRCVKDDAKYSTYLENGKQGESRSKCRKKPRAKRGNRNQKHNITISHQIGPICFFLNFCSDGLSEVENTHVPAKASDTPAYNA